VKLILMSLVLFSVSCSHHHKKKHHHHKHHDHAQALPTSVAEAVASPMRSEDFRTRDIYRHPTETLTFFGIAPEMTVVEIWPSGGWYTEILAPYLATKGKYIIADPAADPKGYTNHRKEWMVSHPDIAKTVTQSTFIPDDSTVLAPEGSVDMILTFRNVHNWLPAKNQEAAFRVFAKALKKGGVLGVVDHRANSKVKFNPESGYVRQKDIVKMAKKAGFVLDTSSEVNANPKDKANYKDGVWTLPPRLTLGEKDKDKYLAIGESDRMTLRFIKK
jgi:predicted methyltransferase